MIARCLERVATDEYPFYTARLYQHGARAYADLAAAALGDERAVRRQRSAAAALLSRLDGLIAQQECGIAPLVGAIRAVCAAEGSRIGHAGDAALWAEVIGRWDALGICYDAA